MSVSLLTVAGRPAVEIEDHAGQLWRYWWSVERRGPSWLVVLTCIDPQTGEAAADERTGRERSYGVLHHPDGGAWCGCPDFRFRRRPAGEVCKHIRDSRELLAVWLALSPPATGPSGQSTRGATA